MAARGRKDGAGKGQRKGGGTKGKKGGKQATVPCPSESSEEEDDSSGSEPDWGVIKTAGLSSSEAPNAGNRLEARTMAELSDVLRRDPMRMDPLEVRFSQLKMRHLFANGRRVADAVPLIKAERCTEAQAAEYGTARRLTAPFPPIEVIRWRCKLRDETNGRPKVDPETGEELFDDQERWFTLDNRRLYCLQEAALQIWPERCVADVIEIKAAPHAQMQGLRKFRTLDLGQSIKVGSRADGVPFLTWSWREHARSLSSSYAGGGESVVDVLGQLSLCKEGACEHRELSKKLSYILRARSRASPVPMDAQGWVRVSELLKMDLLGIQNVAEFYNMVEESNKQKPRYELKTSESNGAFQVLIRARGPTASDASRRKELPAKGEDGAAETLNLEGKGLVAKGQGKGPAAAAETLNLEGKGQGKTFAAKEKGPAGLDVAASTRSPATEAANLGAVAKGKSAVNVERQTGDAVQSSANVRPKATVATAAAADKGEKKSKKEKREKAASTPALAGGRPGSASAAKMQKQLMQQMAMYQYQTMCSQYNQAVMQQRLQEICYMQAWHQMQATQNMLAMQAMEEQEEYEDDEEYEDYEEASLPNFSGTPQEEFEGFGGGQGGLQAQIASAQNFARTSGDIQSRIADARGAARQHSGYSIRETAADANVVVQIAEARDAAREAARGRGQQPMSPAQDDGSLEEKIARALEAARGRTGGGDSAIVRLSV
eukprot:gnl/TRDRNA2_/TRDRNA2_172690_c0_seq10.p1 gnl/TRDRNA2_/TRDRNA2_172690_c0~~gnl/TRDRNA2_/TRDRNA2_172690_c0_seq10.p1  ORF type:complete len:737 (-),score=179.99 gnl/TRDRNA2_/TRDRNA2_172690_c0_seq10:94-2247(-)